MAKNAKRKNNKKGKQGGFTLIELLAVITIMGILMMVAIPAISRTIENTRRDTFMNTAQNYISAVRTMWLSDSFYCRTGDATKDPVEVPSALGDGEYYVLISSKESDTEKGTNTNNTFKPYPYLLQSGGKSSWGNREVTGIVQIKVTNSSAGTGSTGSSRAVYSIALTDGTHGIRALTEEKELKRAKVASTGATATITNAANTTEKIKVSTVLGKGRAAADVTADTITNYICKENK